MSLCIPLSLSAGSTRSALLVVALVLPLMAAAFAAPPAPVVAQDACPEPEQPVDPADPIIVVNTPGAGDRITSPVTIEGEAALFEANVIIRILDAQGEVIAHTFTTALEAGPVMAPFSAPVQFAVTEQQAGCIWVTGEPEQVAAIPVTLAPADAPAAPAPAPTGGDRLAAHSGATLAVLLLLISAITFVGGARVLTRRSRPALVVIRRDNEE